MKNSSRKIITIGNYLYKHQLELILLLGIVLRIIVFILDGPFNLDDHFSSIKYIYERHAIPTADLLPQSYHPPLYYVLASLFFPGGARVVQIFSLFLSIGTLLLFYWLIRNLDFIRPLKMKRHCLLLVCTLPQFISYGNYVSNDVLSFFIGALIFVQIFLYINNPGKINQNLLALYLGLGLLTKGHFLFFFPVLIFLIALINFRKKKNLKAQAISLLIFIFISLGLGCYKAVQNTVHFGRPIVINLDFGPKWAEEQRPTYLGLRSFCDVNILKLCQYPFIMQSIRHSYPLLLYSSFWVDFGQYPLSFRYLRSCVYILGLFPTLLFFIGFLRILFSIKGIFMRAGPNDPELNRKTYEVISLFLLFASLMVIVCLGVKYDVWSAFHSRLLMPSLFSIVIFFNSGLDYVEKKWGRIAGRVVSLLLICLYLSFALYFTIKVAHRVSALAPLVKFIDNLSK